MGGGMRDAKEFTLVLELDSPVDNTRLEKFNADLRQLLQKYNASDTEKCDGSDRGA